MSTLNVKIPDEMEEDIESFLERNPHYLNKSELVRDALRHVISTQGDVHGAPVCPPTAGSRPRSDDPLFTAPTVVIDDPVDEEEIDDVVYTDRDE